MIEFEYLSKGLNALARAHLMGIMAGHYGAAVVAGYFIGEQRPNLDGEVYKGIEGDLERVIKDESLFWAKRKKKSPVTDPDLFRPFPKEKADESLVDIIAEALQKNIGKLRESGHNVIFASLAIRAFKEHPELATPSVTEGIRKLIAGFNNAHPGKGFYGKGTRMYGNKVTLPEEDEGFPPYENMTSMADAVLDEIINKDPKVRRKGYGGLVHVTNHAAAITDLADYGYPELVDEALKSHHRHMRLWRDLPNLANELGLKPTSQHDPHTAAYWTSGKVRYDSALLTHRVKTMFGFDELVEVLDDEPKRKLAYAKLRLIM